MVHGFTTEKCFDQRQLVYQHCNKVKTYLNNLLNEFVSCSLFNGVFLSGCRCAYFSCKRWWSRSCYACLQSCSRMASWVWQRCRHWLGMECFCFSLNELAEVGRQLSVLSFRQFLAGSLQKHYANYALFDLPSRKTLWLFVVLARTRLPNLLLVITRLLLVYFFNVEQCL